MSGTHDQDQAWLANMDDALEALERVVGAGFSAYDYSPSAVERAERELLARVPHRAAATEKHFWPTVDMFAQYFGEAVRSRCPNAKWSFRETPRGTVPELRERRDGHSFDPHGAVLGAVEARTGRHLVDLVAAWAAPRSS